MKRWYNNDKKRSETIKKILKTLEGLTYNEAETILNCALEELSFNSFVYPSESTLCKCGQKPNHILSQNLQA